MKKFRKYYRLFEDLLSGLLIITGLTIIFYGAIMRYVVNSPITWAEEISAYMIVWGTLIGASVALRDEYHIRVELLYAIVPNRIKLVIDLFATAIGMIYSVFIFFTGLQLVLFNYRIKAMSLDTGIDMWMVYLCLPFAGVLLLSRYVKLFIEACVRFRHNETIVLHSEAEQHVAAANVQTQKAMGGIQ